MHPRFALSLILLTLTSITALALPTAQGGEIFPPVGDAPQNPDVPDPSIPASLRKGLLDLFTGANSPPVQGQQEAQGQQEDQGQQETA
jgi:hypothetical protein